MTYTTVITRTLELIETIATGGQPAPLLQYAPLAGEEQPVHPLQVIQSDPRQRCRHNHYNPHHLSLDNNRYS